LFLLRLKINNTKYVHFYLIFGLSTYNSQNKQNNFPKHYI